jgi:Acetyltransferase (GNAT) domain
MGNARPHITLFNDERYQRCNLRAGQLPFRYDHIAGDRLVGTLSGVVEDGILECGHSAPFGGVDLCRPRAAVGMVIELLQAASCRARSDGIRELRIRSRPGYFGANEAAAEFALLNMGASIAAAELSLGLEVWRFESLEGYLAALGDSPRNMIQQGLRAGFGFGEAESTGEWAACYDLLADTKRRRGVTMKLSLDYVLRLRDIFSKQIRMYCLTNEAGLAAAALVYRVRPSWDYIAAWGDDPAQRRNRAMNFLVYALVRTAISDRVGIIDFGISSVNGVPDDGLIHFKRSVGAATGLRLDLRLPL